MDKYSIAVVLSGVALLLTGCAEKKKSQDIITTRVEQKVPKEPIAMQVYDDDRNVEWIGKTYHVSINRQPCDSLPIVKDELGQKFIDNVFTVAVTRSDGSVFFKRQFTKKDVAGYLNDDYRKTGIFEGFVFDRAEGDYLLFAASVGHPQTDEYIPLIIRLSRMGDLDFSIDKQMDTYNVSDGVSADDDEDGV